jgi:AmmeMemoRadiSam system protein B/uncharacterized protein (TIGR00296 family)
MLLAACAELLCATVTGRPATYPDPTLAGAAQQPVAGAYVQLKRGDQARTVAGRLRDKPVPLGEAVADAVAQAAHVEDARLPSLSPTELAHLELEVWLLFNRQRLPLRAPERLAAVEVGKHGLKITRAGQSGLLLPQVAVEQQWDAQRFLEQVGVHAGLRARMWKDAATTYYTFETLCLRGRIGDFDAARGLEGLRPFLSPQELALCGRALLGNIWAFLKGTVPVYSLPEVPDGTVNGFFLALRLPDRRTLVNLSQLSLRPGMPLQATLFQLAQQMTRQLAGQGVPAEMLLQMGLSLVVLADPAMHGTVASPALAGFDPKQRLLLVMERSKFGIVYDPDQSGEQVLAAAARLAQVITPASATVFSLSVASNEPSFKLASVPSPVLGPDERPPAAADRFYPAEHGEWKRLADELLGERPSPQRWTAALVPHAAWHLSGSLAAAVLRRIQIPRTVLVLGPKHTTHGVEWAVAPHRTWALPGASLASDRSLTGELAAEIPGLVLDAGAHREEHAIEVELPFLACLAPETRVVGLAIGAGDLESSRRFAARLANVLRRREERPLLLISSDLNHFATDKETRELDALALAALETLDPEKVYETVMRNRISMCGVLPAVIVLETLRQLGTLEKCERVGYATSADVTGDRNGVVGYAGMLFG